MDLTSKLSTDTIFIDIPVFIELTSIAMLAI
jgi:hypothetical protein